MSKSNPKRPKAKISAEKQWKAAPSKRLVTTAKAKSARSASDGKKLPDVDKAPSKKPKAVKPEVLKVPVQQRVDKLVDLLKTHYPDAKCSLDFSNPLQLLISTMLSAQCTDERVNKVTPTLFAKYKNVKEFARAKLSDVEELVRSTGFFRNKAKNIIECNKRLESEHQGEVPQTMEELSVLPGVGRKTANVVLGNAFGIPGVVVDTHVFRLSHRLGLVRGNNPVEVEKELAKIFPKETWIDLSHWLISHGRAICTARKALCGQCFLAKYCPQIL